MSPPRPPLGAPPPRRGPPEPVSAAPRPGPPPRRRSPKRGACSAPAGGPPAHVPAAAPAGSAPTARCAPAQPPGRNAVPRPASRSNEADAAPHPPPHPDWPIPYFLELPAGTRVRIPASTYYVRARPVGMPSALPASDQTLVHIAPSPARSRLHPAAQRVVSLLVMRPGLLAASVIETSHPPTGHADHQGRPAVR